MDAASRCMSGTTARRRTVSGTLNLALAAFFFSFFLPPAPPGALSAFFLPLPHAAAKTTTNSAVQQAHQTNGAGASIAVQRCRRRPMKRDETIERLCVVDTPMHPAFVCKCDAV